jgi:hypothetical protein
MLITDDIFHAFLQCETNGSFLSGNAIWLRTTSSNATDNGALIVAKPRVWEAVPCRTTLPTVGGAW